LSVNKLIIKVPNKNIEACRSFAKQRPPQEQLYTRLFLSTGSTKKHVSTTREYNNNRRNVFYAVPAGPVSNTVTVHRTFIIIYSLLRREHLSANIKLAPS
jgi:hypothetical protein